ncbi:MAG: phenylalanine 4-monooxygenase [Betaproteobacteria bacterium RIFCSPLOWO2_02_FULL_62_17]|nr:MAG: phenylalanine 4-monooxygenase [Betaproteobacteria bacterium RIFCSPLOWO2_02_FULL_62_17]
MRGNYSRAGTDFVVEQNWSAYTTDEHTLYKHLYQRQSRQVPKYACTQFLDSLTQLDAGGAIPLFNQISARLRRATRWELVAVPGLIPDDVFFKHLAKRRLPVTVWLRKPEEADYIVEPDVFHDIFGHVPLLFDPVYADYLQEYGIGGLKALQLDALGFLARLYWYSIEFGLIRAGENLRAYGAGLLSSSGELAYSVDSKLPHRIRFDLIRIMRTEYNIDSYQANYFVIDSFEQLLRETRSDFTPLYAKLNMLPAIPPDAEVPGDVLV